MQHTKFPYGISDFYSLRQEKFLYIDRTGLIPDIENAGKQLVFLRPRRFGKSLLLSMLENYYDLRKAEDFAALFGDLAIGADPTPEHNQYLVLKWDFSQVSAAGNIGQIQMALFRHVNEAIKDFKAYYASLLKVDSTVYADNAVASFQSLMGAVQNSGQKLYLLIDEYDNFANEVLMQAQSNRQRYEDLLQGEGIVKTLFKTVKSGATQGAIGRVFITGVSPLVLSDMTSGYNVASNIYLLHQFNELCGITHDELDNLVSQVVGQCGLDSRHVGLVLGMMRQFYNGYCFTEETDPEPIYNPTLAFYFLRAYQRNCKPPKQMLDGNLMMDKGKLKYIASLPQGESVIRHLLDDENTPRIARFDNDFGVEAILQQEQSERFMLSLLYFFGIVTITGHDPFGELNLGIPNLVIRALYLEQLQKLALPNIHSQEQALDCAKALYQQANIEPLADFIEQSYFKVFNNRDYRWSNELTIKTAFASLLFNDQFYVVDSETCIERKYIDLTLIVRDSMRQYQLKDLVLEFKYVKLSDSGLDVGQLKQSPRDELAQIPAVQQQLNAATDQLSTYRQALEAHYQEPQRLFCFAVVAIGFERLVWLAV